MLHKNNTADRIESAVLFHYFSESSSSSVGVSVEYTSTDSSESSDSSKSSTRGGVTSGSSIGAKNQYATAAKAARMPTITPNFTVFFQAALTHLQHFFRLDSGCTGCNEVWVFAMTFCAAASASSNASDRALSRRLRAARVTAPASSMNSSAHCGRRWSASSP